MRIGISNLDIGSGRAASVAPNELLWSENFTQTAWGPASSRAGIVLDATAWASGISNGATFTRPTTTTVPFSMEQTRSALTAGTQISLSCDFKAGTADVFGYLRMIYVDAAIPSGVVIFNLGTGAIVFTGSTYTGRTSVVGLGNGVFRCGISGAVAASPAANRVDIGQTRSTDGVSLGGTAGDVVSIHRAKLELRANPSAYVKRDGT